MYFLRATLMLPLACLSSMSLASLGLEYLKLMASGHHAPSVVSSVSPSGATTMATNYLSAPSSTISTTRVRRRDRQGVLVWTLAFSGRNVVDLEVAPNGDTILLSWAQSQSCLTRLDSQGVEIWKQWSGGERFWRDIALVPLDGSDYAIIAAGDRSPIDNPSIFYMARFDASTGGTTWEQYAYDPMMSYPRIRRLSVVGKGVYAAGDARNLNSAEPKHLVVARFDVAGTKQFCRIYPSPSGVTLEVKDAATSTDGQLYVGTRIGAEQGLYKIQSDGEFGYLAKIPLALPTTDVEPTIGGGALIMGGWVSTPQLGDHKSKWMLRQFNANGVLVNSFLWSRTGSSLHRFSAMRQDTGGRIWVAGTEGPYGMLKRLGPVGQTFDELTGSGADEFGVSYTNLHFDQNQNLFLPSVWTLSGSFESRIGMSRNLDRISPYSTSLVSRQTKTAVVKLRWGAPNNRFRLVTLAKVNPDDPLYLPTSVTVPVGALGVRFSMQGGAVSARTEVPFTATYGGRTIKAIAVIDP